MRLPRIVGIHGTLSFAMVSLLALYALTGCQQSREPDETIYACGNRDEAVRAMAVALQKVSSQYGYRLQDNGDEVKDDLIEISRDKSIIPEGTPVNLDITNDGTVVLMAGNFGEAEYALGVSFFHQPSDDGNASFNKAVITSLAAIPGVRIRPAGNGGSESACTDTRGIDSLRTVTK